MGKHKPALLLIAVLLLVSSTATMLPKAQAQGSINASIAPPNVQISYQMEFFENVTSLTPVRVMVNAANESALPIRGMIEAAMRAVNPKVSLDPSSFQFTAAVYLKPATSNVYVISENFTGTVTGAESGTSGAAAYDLGFLDWNLSSSVQTSGVELNNIGNSYLVAPIDAATSRTTFYLDSRLARGGPYSNPVIPGNTTKTFSLLDFSWLPQVSTWKSTSGPLDSNTVWTFNSRQAVRGLPYNLTMGIASPEGTVLGALTAYYNPSFQVTAPSRASVQQSTIKYDLPILEEYAMPAIIIAVVALLAGSVLFERRMSKPQVQYRKKPQRR